MEPITFRPSTELDLQRVVSYESLAKVQLVKPLDHLNYLREQLAKKLKKNRFQAGFRRISQGIGGVVSIGTVIVATSMPIALLSLPSAVALTLPGSKDYKKIQSGLELFHSALVYLDFIPQETSSMNGHLSRLEAFLKEELNDQSDYHSLLAVAKAIVMAEDVGIINLDDDSAKVAREVFSAGGVRHIVLGKYQEKHKLFGLTSR